MATNQFVAKNGLISKDSILVTGSVIASLGFTGSLYGTSSNTISSSYADNSNSSSYSLTASYADNSNSSSYSLTASYAMNGGGSLVSPYNPATMIRFDPDGGITIVSPIRITLYNSGSNDGVTY